VRRAFCALSIALTATSVFAQGVKDVDKAWIKAAKAGDIDALTKLYAPNATMYPPDGPEAKGPDAIRKGFQTLFGENTVQDMVMNYDYYRQVGTLSVASGRFTMTLAPKAGGPAQKMEGRFTSVAERKGGKWLYVSDHASMPLPPPPPAK
jgi:uncharacterized protein (TIGR02246 family)